MTNGTRSRKRKRFIKRIISQSLAVSIVIIILLVNNAILKPHTVAKELDNNIFKTQAEKLKADIVLDQSPKYNLSLSKDLQRFTYNLTEKCPDVTYEMALAVLYTESKFDAKAKNVNRNGSIDRGIAQINSDYTKHYAEVSGYGKDFDPFIAEHGITACVYKLQTLADVWKKQGITNKTTLELYTIQSYHMGVIGFKNYKLKNGAKSGYSNIILQREKDLKSKGEF